MYVSRFPFLNFLISLLIIDKFSLIFLTANQDWAAEQQSLRIFNLQLERERLKRRQQEIAKLNVSLLKFESFFDF
jgi:hypothetical protein